MKKRKILGEKNEWTKVEEKYRGLKITFHYSNHLISNEWKNALILEVFQPDLVNFIFDIPHYYFWQFWIEKSEN